MGRIQFFSEVGSKSVFFSLKSEPDPDQFSSLGSDPDPFSSQESDPDPFSSRRSYPNPGKTHPDPKPWFIIIIYYSNIGIAS